MNVTGRVKSVNQVPTWGFLRWRKWSGMKPAYYLLMMEVDCNNGDSFSVTTQVKEQVDVHEGDELEFAFSLGNEEGVKA